MYLLFYALNGIASVVSLVCFIMVVVAMFKSGDKTLGIVSIALCWCIGGLIAFVTGWMNADRWNVRQIMLVWSVAIVAGILFGVLAGATAPRDLIIINQPGQP